MPAIAVDGATADRSSLAYPAPDGGSFFLPAGARPSADPRDRALDDLFEALALGVKSYYEKTGAFKSLGIALSGGRDSMLTLLVAWRAAQLITRAAPPISAFYMPSRHSRRRHEAGGARARRGTRRRRCRPSRSTRPSSARSRRPSQMLGGEQPTELTRQNIQARIRGQRMWNWANSSGALFLQTGDMSEKAVGYTTIGGDLEGALSVIANVPKTVVIALLERLETRFGFKGVSATLHTDPGPGARRQAGRRERADAVPGARRLPAPLRRREDVAGRSRRGAEVAVSRTTRPSQLADWADAVHEALLAVDLQVGAVAAVAARRLARSRSRARAADAGRSEERVD